MANETAAWAGSSLASAPNVERAGGLPAQIDDCAAPVCATAAARGGDWAEATSFPWWPLCRADVRRASSSPEFYPWLHVEPP